MRYAIKVLFSIITFVTIHLYRPQTKLREDNVFTGVCLPTGRWSEYLRFHVLSRGGYLLYQVPSGRWVCPGGGDVQGVGMSEEAVGWVCPGGYVQVYVQGWVCLGGGYIYGKVDMSGGWVHTPQTWDTMGYSCKRAVGILLECFLVFHLFTQYDGFKVYILIGISSYQSDLRIKYKKCTQQKSPLPTHVFVSDSSFTQFSSPHVEMLPLHA